MKKVVLGIPMWNRADLTDSMIHDLNQQTAKAFDVVIVDDGSDVPYVLPEFSKGDIRMVRHPDNLGCSCAINSAVAACIDMGADVVCIMNNDIKIDSGLVEVLIQYHETGDYDIVCPSVSDSSCPPVVQTHNISGEYRSGFVGLCFSVSSLVFAHRFEECEYYFDTDFRYKSIVTSETSVWGNLCASSSLAICPNGPILESKWGTQDVVKSISNRIFGERIYK
jgi:GT2 family glycosyltransferase